MEIFRALAVIAESPGKETADFGHLLELGSLPSCADYTELFVFQLRPYASIYLGPGGKLGGDARDRIAGFWRAVGLTPPAEPDHISIMLAFYAELIEHARREKDLIRKASLNRAREVFLFEHLISWLPVYLSSVIAFGISFYRQWAELVSKALFEEGKASVAGDGLPLALRDAPGIVDPREASLDEFIASLLAPLRSGMIVTRADLARAARELSLRVRIAERRLILKTLLDQDVGKTLCWLSQEAQSWKQRNQLGLVGTNSIRSFWTSRAESSASLLADLHVSARGAKTD